MSKSFGTLKSVAAGFIGTFAGIATVGGIKSVINDLEKLNTVSERTGIAAKELSGLAFAASQTGTDLEVMAKGVNKLNIALSQLSSGKNKDLKEILTQLGLPEFAKGAIDAEEALLQLAEVFPRLSDADQARVALAAFGKTGLEMIPALQGGRKELEALIEKGKDLFPVTDKMAKAADDFNDSMSAVALAIKGTLLPALDFLLPKLTKIASGFTDARRAGLGFFEWVAGLTSAAIDTPFTTLGGKIKGINEELDKLAKRPQVKTFTSDVPARVEHLKKLREYFKLQQQSQALELGVGVQSNEGRVSVPGELKLKPEAKKATRGRTRAAERDDSAQRLLDQQIQAFQRSIEQERNLAQTRNDFLERFYDDGLISLADYTKARADIMAESTARQKIEIDKEIEALEGSKKGKPADDVIAINTKINDLVSRQADLNLDLKTSQQNLYYDNIKAGKEYDEVLRRIHLRFLESKGDTEGAARLSFSLDNADDLTRIDTALKSDTITPEKRAALEQAKEEVNAMRDRNIEMAKFDVLAEKVNATRNDAADAEERINQAIETGQISQIDGLQQISAIRTKLSADLLTQGELLENIALLTNDKNQIEFLKGLGIEIERVNAALDPLRDKMEDLLSSGVSGFFQDIASGTVSAKQAFKSMIDDFTKRLTAFISDQFFKQLFGEKGALGGVAGLLTGSGGQQQQQPQQQGGGFAGALASFFGQGNTQAAAPITQGVATSLGSGSAGAGAEAASALKDVAASSTATSFALQEFSDQGVAGATQSLFENVAASSIEQSAEQTATVSLTAFTIATDAATAAMVKQATAQAISGAVQSSAGGYAEGGQVSGPGTGTSDSIPVLLSNKEFVVRAKPVQEPGALAFLTRFNKMGMKAMQRYSMGGLVGTSMGMSSQALVAAGGVNLVQNFTVEPRTPKETQLQLASAAYQGGMRAYRRNR